MRVFFGVALLLLASMSAAAESRIREHYITVLGESSVEVAPDFVSVELVLVATGSDTGRLKMEVDAKARQLLDAASKLQIATPDVKSSGVQITRDYATDRNDNEVFKGYVVTRKMSIKL